MEELFNHFNELLNYVTTEYKWVPWVFSGAGIAVLGRLGWLFWPGKKNGAKNSVHIGRDATGVVVAGDNSTITTEKPRS